MPYDSDAPAMLVRSTTQDIRNPNLQRILTVEYQLLDFAGIKTYQKKSETTGYQSHDGSQAVSNLTLTYDQTLCPIAVTEFSTLGTLTLRKDRAEVREIAQSLHCLPRTINWTGSHGNRDLDFSQTLIIGRNRIGLPPRFASGKAGERLLQELTYDSGYRISSVYTPKDGKKEFTWDGDLLSTITDGSGKKTQVTGRDPLKDQILALTSHLGDGQTFEEYFKHDDWNRLTSKWDNIHPSSESNPIAKTVYQFASENSLGKILTEARVESHLGSHWSQQIEFFTAGGEARKLAITSTVQSQRSGDPKWAPSCSTRSRIRGS